MQMLRLHSNALEPLPAAWIGSFQSTDGQRKKAPLYRLIYMATTFAWQWTGARAERRHTLYLEQWVLWFDCSLHSLQRKWRDKFLAIWTSEGSQDHTLLGCWEADQSSGLHTAMQRFDLCHMQTIWQPEKAKVALVWPSKLPEVGPSSIGIFLRENELRRLLQASQQHQHGSVTAD